MIVHTSGSKVSKPVQFGKTYPQANMQHSINAVQLKNKTSKYKLKT